MKRGRAHLPLGIVTPGIQTCILGTCHAVAPSCVHHAAALGRNLLEVRVQANVAQTLERRDVGNVCTGRVGRTGSGTDHDALETILSQETGKRSTRWTGTDNQKLSLQDFTTDGSRQTVDTVWKWRVCRGRWRGRRSGSSMRTVDGWRCSRCRRNSIDMRLTIGRTSVCGCRQCLPLSCGRCGQRRRKRHVGRRWRRAASADAESRWWHCLKVASKGDGGSCWNTIKMRSS